MMGYCAVFVALVALSLQASARNIKPAGKDYRRSIQDNEIDISDNLNVEAPWHGHADKGYPEFDGNPFKTTLVTLGSILSGYAADAVEDDKDAPAIIKTILKGGQKADWKDFDEFLDYWGSAQVAMLESAMKSAVTEGTDEDSNDNKLIDFNDDDKFYYQVLGA